MFQKCSTQLALAYFSESVYMLVIELSLENKFHHHYTVIFFVFDLIAVLVQRIIESICQY